jgi:hypothetical protein
VSLTGMSSLFFCLFLGRLFRRAHRPFAQTFRSQSIHQMSLEYYILH